MGPAGPLHAGRIVMSNDDPLGAESVDVSAYLVTWPRSLHR